MKHTFFFFAFLLLALAALPARAEIQFSIYGGANTNFSSDVTTKKGPVNSTRTIDWEGKSFDMPPYWGARGTYWFEEGPKQGWGVAVDFTHAKAYGDLNFRADPTYYQLEFTDGLNLLIFTPMYRFAKPAEGSFVPYIGAGVGMAIPHVEVGLKAFPGNRTLEYEVSGVAAQVLAGMEYFVTPHWSLFGEGKLSYADIHGDLVGGGTIDTHVISPQLALGATFHFGI